MSIGMELAPYFPLAIRKLQQVVKASSGHFPQPFLIRDVIRTKAKIMSLLSYFQIRYEIFNNFGVRYAFLLWFTRECKKV
jgi:hypothetical protein